MFVEDFNPVATLAAAKCPRCHAVGLTVIDPKTYSEAPARHRHQARYIVNPSVPARCPACELVAEWPSCCDE